MRPLLEALPLNRWHWLVMVMLFILLPALAGGAVLIAQQKIELPLTPEMEKLAGQSVSYWLIALAGLCITSWSMVVKWGLNQLESQRAANAELVKKLVGYMETDHANTMVVMNKVTDVMARILLRLDQKEGRP